jgi:hypothetical protein
MKQMMPIANIVDIGDLMKGTIDSITDYLKEREEQETERQRVEACLQAITKKMETDRRKFEMYLNKSFEEREKLYQKVDGLLQASIEKNNVEMSKLALNFMINVYNKNPMDGFQNTLDGVSADLLSAGTKNYLD